MRVPRLLAEPRSGGAGAAKSLHNAGEAAVVPAVDEPLTGPVRGYERQRFESRLESPPLETVRDEHDARAPIVVRPLVERTGWMTGVLHDVDEHRAALDVEDSLHPQQAWPLVDGQEVQPQLQARRMDADCTTNAEREDGISVVMVRVVSVTPAIPVIPVIPAIPVIPVIPV